MSDWQKAREAAIQAILRRRYGVSMKASECTDMNVLAYIGGHVDAALSAFEEAGYFMIGIDELRVLLRKGSTALERYESKVAERQK